MFFAGSGFKVRNFDLEKSLSAVSAVVFGILSVSGSGSPRIFLSLFSCLAVRVRKKKKKV